VDVVEEIVCKVNGDIITHNDLDHDRKQLEQQLRQQNLAGARLQDVVNSKMADLLRDRIDRLLMVQKGKEMDLKIDSDLNKRIAELQRRSGIADPQKFQEWVKEQSGEAYEDYRGDMKNQLLMDSVIQEEIIRKIQFKKEELQAYYEQHKNDFQRQERVFLRNIFVSTAGKDATAQAAAEKKAKDLSARAKKGEKFADLANPIPTTPPQPRKAASCRRIKKDKCFPSWKPPSGTSRAASSANPSSSRTATSSSAWTNTIRPGLLLSTKWKMRFKTACCKTVCRRPNARI